MREHGNAMSRHRRRRAMPLALGSRRCVPALKGHGGASWHRWRYPFTRRTPLLFETDFNPLTLRAERRILNPAPLLWVLG